MIRFKVPDSWINDEEQSQNARLRIAHILTEEGITFQKGRGVTWSLGSSDDWSLEIDPKKGEFEIKNRLRSVSPELMEALKTSLVFLLDIEDFQN